MPAKNPKINLINKRYNYLTMETEAAYHNASVKLGLSDSVSLILYTICNNDGVCLLGDICRLAGMRKQTLNSAVRKLEAEEVVYLKAADGKKKYVCLTEKGKILSEKTVLKIIEIENEILESWTEEEREIYVMLAEKYLKSFREKIKKL
ncbi:MAG: MarR family transcriptional regulator [Ruminiclostridium sp.]|nr:MarR family transcriptional regulator [Ruminiclostridium sp.]